MRSCANRPACRSLASCTTASLLGPPAYSTGMPNLSLKALVMSVRTAAVGGPLTETLPSFLAASTSAFQSSPPAAALGLAAVAGFDGAEELVLAPPQAASARIIGTANRQSLTRL